MADEKGETSLNASGTATPKGKLESLTKDDLVKFVKRQTIMLQKLKAKNAELESQISSSENEISSKTADSNVKDESEKDSQITRLEKQLQELQEEKDEAVQAYNAVQASQEKAAEQIKKLEDDCLILKQEKDLVFDKYVAVEKANKNFLEDIECLKMKDETLTSTLLYLQQEQTTMSENNKKLIAEKSDLQIKLEDLEEEAIAWKTEKESLLAELLKTRSALEESKEINIDIVQLQSKLKVVEDENLQIQKQLENLEFNYEQRGEQVELLQSEICRLKDLELEYSDLKEKLKKAEERVQQFEAESPQQEIDPDHSQAQIAQLLAETEELRGNIQTLQAEFNKQQSIYRAEIERVCQEKEQLNENCCHLQSELEMLRTEKFALQTMNEELVTKVEQMKISIDAVNEENERCKGKISSFENTAVECEKPELESKTAEIAQLEIGLQEANRQKEILLEKVTILEGKVEDSEKTGAAVLSEKIAQIDKLTQDLASANSKLMDFEASLGSEFNIEVIQNLQQELVETKMKLSEIENSTSMYGAGGQGSAEDSTCLQQTGWSDLPDIEEEPENDQPQLQRDQSAQEEHQQNEHSQVGGVHQETDGQVCVERIERFIKVSSHVLAEDSYQGGSAEEMYMLKSRIAELEKENEDLRLKFEQLLEKNLEKCDEKKGDDVEMDKDSEIIASLQAHRQHLEEKLVILGDKHETVTFELEELHAERESLKSEMEVLQNQLREWENMMGMLKEEKDCLAHELEDYTNKDISLRKELEFLLSSLNEAITERDTLQDEVFKLSQHEDSAQGDVKEMKLMIEDIIAERNNLLSELDKVLCAKADSTATIENLKQEIEHLRTEKDDIEREKESLLVRFHLAEDKETNLSEGYETQLKISSEMEESLQELTQQSEAYRREIESLKSALDVANSQMKAAEDVADERKNYSLNLESQKLEDDCLILKQEKDLVFDKYVAVEKANKNFLEDIECLKMKDETLTSTLLYLQQEQTTMSENNKKLIAEKSDLQIKLEDLEEEAIAWKTEKESLLAELLKTRSALEESKEINIDIVQLQSKLKVVEDENLQIQKQLENLEFNYEQRGEQVELLQSEICRLKDLELEYSDLKEKLKKAEERVQQFEAESPQQEIDPDHSQAQIAQLLAETEELRGNIQTLQAEFNKQQSIYRAEIERVCQEKEQLNENCCHLQSELEMLRTEKFALQTMNEELVTKVEQMKISIDAVNEENERCKGKISSFENTAVECEKPELESKTAEIAQLEIGLQEANRQKEILLEKVTILEGKVEDSEKTGAAVLSEKIAQIDKLTQDLASANSKLMDFEASLGSEFNIEVIQNLQQELVETKMKLSEIENSTSMYGAGGQGSAEDSTCLQQTGWSDLPDIEEEPENDQPQLQRDQSAQEEHQQNEHSQVGGVHQETDGQVCVERIERFIKVSSHVLAEDSYQGGSAEEMYMLKSRIAELEKENEDLRLKFEQLLEKNLEKCDEKKGDDVEMDKDSEIIASLQAHRQHLEEKLVILGDKHETVTFELEELHAERESLKSEMEVLQNQLREWENMMGMLKEEKDCLAHELEDYTNKDISLRKELEFLLSSLNEAITERDTLQDEVFKLSQHEDSAQGDVKEMKLMIEDIIAERNNLLSELDKVLCAKADSTATIENLKQEIEHLRTEKDDIEREKESLLVRFHLAEDKETNLSEGYETQLKISSEMEESLQELTQQSEAYRREIESLKSALDVANSQMKAAEDVADERKNYSLNLESQILELSSALSDSKKRNGNLKDQLDQLTSDNSATAEYVQQIADLQNQQVEYQRSIEQLTSSRDQLQEERDQMSVHAASIAQEIDGLRQQLSAVVNEKVELDHVIVDLKMKNQNAEEKLLALKKDFEVLTTEKMETDKQLSWFQDQVADLESRQGALQQELESKHASLQEELSKQASMQEELELKSKAVSALEELVETIKLQQHELQQQLTEADEKLNASVDEKNKLIMTKEELLTSVRALEAEKLEFQSQADNWLLKLEDVQARIENRRTETDNFQMKIEVAESYLLQIREKASTAETSNPDLVYQLQQMQLELQQLKGEIDTVRLQMENHEDKTGEHWDRFEQVIRQSCQIFSKLEAEKRRCTDFEKLILESMDSLQQESLQGNSDNIDTLTLERDNIMMELRQEQNKVHDLEQQIVQRGIEIVDLNNKIVIWEQENVNLVQRLEEISSELAVSVDKLSDAEEKCKELREKCTQLEKLLLEKDAEMDRCREQINSLTCLKDDQVLLTEQSLKDKLDLEYHLQKMITEKEMLKNQLAEAENTVKPLQEHVASLEHELETTQKGNNELLLQLDSLKEEKSIWLNQSLNSEEVVSDLKDKLTKSTEAADVLSLQLEEVKTERVELVSKIQQAEKAVETLKQSLDVAQEEREAAVKHLESSVLEKETLNSELLILTKEKENLLSSLLISEEEVVQLKKQIAELKENLSDSKLQIEESKTRVATLEFESKEKSEENLQKSSEESSEIDLLRKQLKEKEEINSKLKQLAIKTKKELGDKQTKLDVATKQISQLTKTKDALEAMNETLRKQSEDTSDLLSQQFKNLQENYKKIQASLDATQDEAEQEKKALKTAQKDIEQLVVQLTVAKGEMAANKEEKEHLLKQFDGLWAEVKSKDSTIEELRTKLRATDMEMAAVRMQLEEINKEKQKVDLKLTESESHLRTVEDEYKGHIAKLEASLKGLEDQLSSARQSMKQNSMLDLEMADYERTIFTLHSQLADRDRKIEELKAEIDKQEQTISLMQTQIDAAEEQRIQADDRATKLKALLVKTKKDLADARRLETAQRSSDAHLRGQLESTSQQVEEFKVQVSQLTSDNQKLQEKIRSLNDNSQRTAKALESRVESLTNELQATRSELNTVQAEYHSYKVRAHNVLRQQKSKNPTDENTEIDKHEKERYENAIDHLKMRLQETQDQLQAARKEAEQLQEEHDHLSQRHAKLIADLEDRESSFRLRLENSMKEKADALAELQDRIASLETQKTFQTQKFKEQINKLKDENAEVVELLQKQLDASEMDNIRLQREIQQLQRMSRMREESVEHTSPSEFYPITAHPVEERQEGEGSEIVELEPLKTVKPHSQPTAFTFEQLIATPMKELSVVKPVSPTIDEEVLKSDLAASQKKIDHLTELLSESEESVSRLTEQARILKDEIRRMERNMEREKETQNMEYLKNIFLQFMCPKVGEQRQQLVPVLTTMLKLSPDEKASIQAVAQGDEQAAQGGQGGVGWGAYLHRWSGLT